MKKGASRPKFGDIYELRLSKGVAYLQYILRHTRPPQYGPVIRVLPGVFSHRIDDPEGLADQEERFLALYWLPGAVTDGIADRVGHREVPSRFDTWPLFKDQSISKWRIWNGIATETENPLKPEHYDLPMKELVPRSLLIARIESGWHPRDEVFLRNPELRETYEKWKREQSQMP